MKRKAISVAVATACAAGGSAEAFDPDVRTPAYEVRIAGATAPQATLRDVIIDNICDSDIDYQLHKSDAHWAIYCVVDGDDVAFRKNNDGSGTGTGPVDNASTLVEFFVGGQSVVDCSASAASTGSTAYTAWKDCGNSLGAGGEGLTNLVADVGISDIEPGAFVGALAPLETPTDVNTNIDFKNESSMDVRTLAGLNFGVVVTERLYWALQNDQFPAGHPLFDECNPAGANYNNAESDSVPQDLVNHDEGDTEKCMPNMASHTVRSIFQGSLNLWTELLTGTGATNLFLQSIGQSWQPSALQVKVCRRVQGSGTHARTAVTFLRTNCGAGSIAMANPTCNTRLDGADCNNGVEGAQGSSDLTNCLNAAAGNNKWALGYHSLEKNADLDHPWRFVKIDGFAPTLENMLSGNYANFGEVTMQKRTVRTGEALNVGANYVGAQGNQAEVDQIFEDIVAAMSGPAAAQSLNALAIFNHPFGNSGWSARPATGRCPGTVSADVRRRRVSEPGESVDARQPGHRHAEHVLRPVCPAGHAGRLMAT